MLMSFTILKSLEHNSLSTVVSVRMWPMCQCRPANFIYLLSVYQSLTQMKSSLSKMHQSPHPPPCGYMRRLDVGVQKAHNKCDSAWNSAELKGCSHC